MTIQKQVWAMAQSGTARKEIATKLNLSTRQVRRYVEQQRALAEADPATVNAMQAAQSNALPHSFWVKTDNHSVYYKVPGVSSGQDILADIADAFANVPAYVPAEAACEPDRKELLTVYPVFDLHAGMFAWGKETGWQDYDLSHMADDVREAFGNLDILTPRVGKALLILGGDTLHIDDERNETPQSKHKLDADGRYYKVLQDAINALCWMVDHLHKRHSQVIVRVLRGNHDQHSHMVLSFALSERYRNAPSVVIEKTPRDLFMIQHGNSMIAAHHGDKSPPQRLAMMIADTCPFWSATRDRHLLTGHIHHDSTKDFPGIKWHSLRAFCPPDAYGAGFAPRRALQAMVFHANKGLVLTAHDGLWRE